MTLIAVMSAKGAPGVTTLTVALAALAGADAVAADLDADGGDLALRYRRDDGRPLDPDLGLLSLAAAIRRGGRATGRDGTVLAGHVQRASGGLAVLAGVSRPEQVAGLGPLWRHVAVALRTGGTVFADCGRVGPSSPVLPLLTSADAVLVVARAELEELAHLRERLRFLAGTMPSPAGRRIGVVLVTAERDRAAPGRAQRLLGSAGLDIPVLGVIADDPKGAAILRGVRNGRPGRTLLIRSARSLLPAVAGLAGLATVAASASGAGQQPNRQARQPRPQGAAPRPPAGLPGGRPAAPPAATGPATAPSRLPADLPPAPPPPAPQAPLAAPAPSSAGPVPSSARPARPFTAPPGPLAAPVAPARRAAGAPPPLRPAAAAPPPSAYPPPAAYPDPGSYPRSPAVNGFQHPDNPGDPGHPQQPHNPQHPQHPDREH